MVSRVEGVVERETVVVKLVKSFPPLLSAIVLGASSLAFIVSFRCRPLSKIQEFGVLSPGLDIENFVPPLSGFKI